MLSVAQAGLFAYTGAFEACVHCINAIETRLLSAVHPHQRQQLARVAAIRCFIACIENNLPQAESLAEQALRDLPKEDLGFRPGIYVALGDSYRQNGQWEAAKACYARGLSFTEAPPIRVQSVHIFGALADLYLRQGRLHDAADCWRKALASIQEPGQWGHYQLPVAGWIYTRMGELLYEWNQLPEAQDHLARGLQHAELGGDIRTLIAGNVLMARLKLAEDDVEAATHYLEQARPLVEEAAFPDWSSRFERCQLELWLAQEKVRTAVDWLDALEQSDALAHRLENQGPENEVAQLTVARVLIVKGDQPSVARALGLLRQLSETVATEGKAGIQIEALALHALAQAKSRLQVEALVSLEAALSLAEPEGYVRLFVDLGLPMVRLLQEARSRTVMPDYVNKLLAAVGADVATAPVAKMLLDPLTAREQEVLQLMAAGLLNREIAERLVISAGTAKKHVANICDKLGVSNRTQAAAKARDLGLLG